MTTSTTETKPSKKANLATKPAAEMTLEEARAAYRAIRARSHAETREVFEAEVRKIIALRGLPETPASFVIAARAARFLCRRCAGTGAFVTRVENGQPKGPGGICYRCAGKAYRTDEDERRNFGADIHQRIY